MPKPAIHTERPTVLFLWADRILFVGHLDQVAPHRHAADVCLVALKGRLGVRIPPSQWWAGGSALIPAGCTHELDLAHSYVAVFYNDPHRPRYKLLAAREGHTPKLGIDAEDALRDALLKFAEPGAYERPGASETLEQVLAAALGAYPEAPALDPRVVKAIEVLQLDLHRNCSIEELASAVAISPSRLQHLFLLETGVPMRRLRTWIRFREAVTHIARGVRFTDAALTTGFASSAHFSHAFKAMFGVSAREALSGSTPARFIHMF